MIAEWITSLLALSVSILFFILSFNFPTLSSDPAGPALFPRIFCLLTGIPSLLLISKMICNRKSSAPTPFSFFKDLMHAWQGRIGETETLFRKMTVVFAFSFLYPWFITRIGFFLATTIYAFGLMKILKTNTLSSILVSVIVSTVLHFSFFYILEAYIPPGTWLDLVF